MTEPAERPAGLPENFQSVEALAESYKQAQGQLTRTSQELAGLRAEPAPQQPAPQAPAAPFQQGLGVHTPDPAQQTGTEYISQFAQEYATNGGLSPQSYAKIQADKGWDRSLVDGWIQGQAAMGEQIRSTVFGAVGGEGNYQAMQAHLHANLSQPEIDAFNAAVDSGNPAMAQMAVQAMWQRYQAEAGGQMNLMQGTNPAGPTSPGGLNPGEGYPNEAAWQADVDKDEYGTDPEFRKTVIRKMAQSPWAYQNPRHKVVDRDTFLEGALKGLQLPG